MQQMEQNQFVEIKVVTWSKDSHGLFDYESKSINVKKCKIEQPCQILRKEDIDVEFAPIDHTLSQESQNNYMTSVIQSEDIMNENTDKQLQNPQIVCRGNNVNQDNFLIVRSLKNKEGQQKGYQLSPGDIVKLGRIEYLVHEVSDGQNTESVSNQPQSELHHVYTVKEEELNMSTIDNNIEGSAETSVKQCKICLMDDQSAENFFISPCNCKGSCQYVHFLCLKTWVESKIKKKSTGNTVSYNWKKSECELCSAPLPKKVRNRNEELELIDIERPQLPYLLLESLAKDKKVSKNLFMITALGEKEDEEPVCLGRGHQCEVRISDISVSRQHAFIKYNNGKFIITDNNSKFGTLIKMKSPICITSDKVAIQVGRTVITFVIKSEQNNNNQEQQQNKAQQPIGSSSTIGSNQNLALTGAQLKKK